VVIPDGSDDGYLNHECGVEAELSRERDTTSTGGVKLCSCFESYYRPQPTECVYIYSNLLVFKYLKTKGGQDGESKSRGGRRPPWWRIIYSPTEVWERQTSSASQTSHYNPNEG